MVRQVKIMKPQKTPFTEWESALSAEEVFSDGIGLNELQMDSTLYIWRGK
jgi:hypothetical protein